MVGSVPRLGQWQLQVRQRQLLEAKEVKEATDEGCKHNGDDLLDGGGVASELLGGATGLDNDVGVEAAEGAYNAGLEDL